MARTSDLRAFLSALGLEQHAAAFEAEEIDLDTLRTLTDADLRALGLTAMGPRKKLLAAIGALGAGPAATASVSPLGAEGGAPPSATPPPFASDTHPPWPGGLDAATLPTWLAHPWAALRVEEHPRVRLQWLIDTAELVVRWTVAVALAEVVHARGGALPASVADAIAEHVERPTLGRWLLILGALGKVAPVHPLLTVDLFGWAERTLAPCFRGEEAGGTIEGSLLVLRNQAAHGGGLGRKPAADLVAAHLPTLVRLLEGVRASLGGATLVADGVRLVGTAPPSRTTPRWPGRGPGSSARGARCRSIRSSTTARCCVSGRAARCRPVPTGPSHKSTPAARATALVTPRSERTPSTPNASTWSPSARSSSSIGPVPPARVVGRGRRLRLGRLPARGPSARRGSRGAREGVAPRQGLADVARPAERRASGGLDLRRSGRGKEHARGAPRR